MVKGKEVSTQTLIDILRFKANNIKAHIEPEFFNDVADRLEILIKKKVVDKDVRYNMKDFKENEVIIYQNGDRFEIGRIKRLTEDGAFVYYHSGDTASKTPYDCMHKLINNYCIVKTTLGGGTSNE